VIEADYLARIASRVRADEPLYRDSYHFCMFSCLAKIQIAKRKGKLPLVPVTCLFERRSRKQDRTLEWHYDRITEAHFGAEDFSGKYVGAKEDPAMLPTQATDFVLYYLWRELRGILDGSRPGPHRLWFDRLENTGRISGPKMFDPGLFGQFVRMVEEGEIEMRRTGAWPAVAPKRYPAREGEE